MEEKSGATKTVRKRGTNCVDRWTSAERTKVVAAMQKDVAVNSDLGCPKKGFFFLKKIQR